MRSEGGEKFNFDALAEDVRLAWESEKGCACRAQIVLLNFFALYYTINKSKGIKKNGRAHTHARKSRQAHTMYHRETCKILTGKRSNKISRVPSCKTTFAQSDLVREKWKYFFWQQWLWKERYCRVMMLHLISLLPSAQSVELQTCLCPCYWQRANFSQQCRQNGLLENHLRQVYTPCTLYIYIYDREAFLAAKSTIKPVTSFPFLLAAIEPWGAGCKRGRRKRRCAAAFTQKTNALSCKERYNDREKF